MDRLESLRELYAESPITQEIVRVLRESMNEIAQWQPVFQWGAGEYGSNDLFNTDHIIMDINLVYSDNQYYITQLSKLETFY